MIECHCEHVYFNSYQERFTVLNLLTKAKNKIKHHLICREGYSRTPFSVLCMIITLYFISPHVLVILIKLCSKLSHKISKHGFIYYFSCQIPSEQ